MGLKHSQSTAKHDKTVDHKYKDNSPAHDINEDEEKISVAKTIDIFCKVNTRTILLQPTIEDTVKDLRTLLCKQLQFEDNYSIRLSVTGTGKPLQLYRKIIDYNLQNGSFVDATMTLINASNSNKSDSNAVKYHCYSYCTVIMMMEYWCRLFGVKQIEMRILDYIAIYSCFAAPKIIYIKEHKNNVYHFDIGLKLNGCSAYFMNNNDEIVDKYWLDQYMELKLARIQINNESGSANNLSNITKISYDANQEETSNYKDEIFTLNTCFPNNYIEIYKREGRLDNIECWCEFEFVNFLKGQNEIKNFKLPSEKFRFSYRNLTIQKK